jgi:hypothetical protein
VNRFAKTLRDTARISYCQSLEVAQKRKVLFAASGTGCRCIETLQRFDSDASIVSGVSLNKFVECHCEACLEVIDP